MKYCLATLWNTIEFTLIKEEGGKLALYEALH